MIVYYVEPEGCPDSRTWHRTRAEAHAEAKSMHRREPAVVKVSLWTDSTHIVQTLNGEPAFDTLEAWTLSPRKGLRPLDLKEL